MVLNPLSVSVHDLFVNTSIRFNQRDDTLSLAVKLDGVGGWHLAGDAVYKLRTVYCLNSSNWFANWNKS